MMHVRKALAAIPGVEETAVRLAEKSAKMKLSRDMADEAFKAAAETAGQRLADIRRSSKLPEISKMSASAKRTADIRSYSIQFFQLFRIHDLDHTAREFDHPLILEIAKHSGDHFPMGAEMIGDGFMGDLQLISPFNGHFF